MSLKTAASNETNATPVWVVIVALTVPVMFVSVLICSLGLLHAFKSRRTNDVPIRTMLRHIEEQPERSNNPTSDTSHALNTLSISTRPTGPCPICLESMLESDALVETHCKHAFHHSCMIQWLGVQKTCPVCRKNLNQM